MIDARLKTAIENVQGLLAVQIADYADIKTEHYLFQLLSANPSENVLKEFKLDDQGDPVRCITTEYSLVYQLDLMHCRDGILRFTELLAEFESGEYFTQDDLAYVTASQVDRVPSVRTGQRHFRHTADLEFRYTNTQCRPTNIIDGISISPCPALPISAVLNIEDI